MGRSSGPRATDDERKERRRAANRRSARKSRYRAGVITGELENSLAELSKRNKELRAENEAFRNEVLTLQKIMLNTKTLQWHKVRFKYSLENVC